LLLSPFSEIRRPWFCSGSEVDGSGRRLQRVLNLDAECIETWSSDYEVVGRMRGYPIPKLSRDADPQTTLVMANMGAGKSKELFNGLLPRLPADSSVCLIAPNIALARKYHEETKRRGLDFVCYLDEPGARITARRVVVCINSIARVLPRFDLVVMDEVNFTLTNMASTVMKDKKQVFMAMEGIVSGAKAAFLSDAHLNCPRVVEWIQSLRHTSRFYTIRNRGVWPSARKALILPMPGPLVGRGQPKATYSLLVEIVLEMIESGKTVMVRSLPLFPPLLHDMLGSSL
jgi:thymidine kinase